MPRYKTALGIDISDGRINLVLLKKQADGIKLLKAASCPVPDGAVKNGNIKNASVLAKAIKKLKTRNGIHTHPTAVSLITNPTLAQILELPRDASGNVRQFVNNEVKHYAILPIKKAAIDFCGIKSLSNSNNRRVLVVSTDGQKVSTYIKALNKHGLNIEVIEPAWIAYTRACFEKKIAAETDAISLFAIISNGILILSLFRDQTLNFVRVKPIEPDTSQSKKYLEWLTEEIDAVVKFYESNSSKKCKKWQVTLATTNSEDGIEKNLKQLKNKFQSAIVEIRTSDDAFLDTPLAEKTGKNQPSATAVGLAMGLLNFSGHGLNINLLPSEVVTAKSKEKQTLLIANIAAVIFILMVISIGLFQSKTKNVNIDKIQQKQTEIVRNTQELLREQNDLQKQVAEIKSRLELMDNFVGGNPVPIWGRILNDIKIATPKTIRIKEIFSGDNSNLQLSGQALSYEAVYSFVDALNACKNIESASLIGSQNDNRSNNLLEYSINCTVAQ